MRERSTNDPEKDGKRRAFFSLGSLRYKLYGKTLERMSDNLKDSFDSVKLSFGFPFAFRFRAVSPSLDKIEDANETTF